MLKSLTSCSRVYAVRVMSQLLYHDLSPDYCSEEPPRIVPRSFAVVKPRNKDPSVVREILRACPKNPTSRRSLKGELAWAMRNYRSQTKLEVRGKGRDHWGARPAKFLVSIKARRWVPSPILMPRSLTADSAKRSLLSLTSRSSAVTVTL